MNGYEATEKATYEASILSVVSNTISDREFVFGELLGARLSIKGFLRESFGSTVRSGQYHVLLSKNHYTVGFRPITVFPQEAALFFFTLTKHNVYPRKNRDEGLSVCECGIVLTTAAPGSDEFVRVGYFKHVMHDQFYFSEDQGNNVAVSCFPAQEQAVDIL